MLPPSPNPAAAARHSLLARTAGVPLPLGRRGQGLRRRLREAGPIDRSLLLDAWATALRALHAAGWGTEDPVAAAIVSPLDHVHFLPDLVWPLGALTTRRPIAAWLDVLDALAWLDSAGLGRDAAPALSRLPPPWPAWPRLDRPGPHALIGPPAELAALAVHARLPWLPASELAAPAGRAWALTALEARAAWLIPVADPAWLTTLRTLPAHIARADTVGGALPFDEASIDALGLHPSALVAPSAPRHRGGEAATAQRALDAAPLAPDDESRAREEAGALLALLERDMAAPIPPASAPDRYAAILDLARRGRARDLSLRAALGRGLSLATATDPERQRAGRADLTEARRLAVAQGSAADAVHTDAAALLASALDEEPRTTPDPRPTDDPLARTWRAVATAASSAALDAGEALLEDAPLLLAQAVTADAPFLLGAVVELLGGAAVAHGQETRIERLLERLLSAGAPRTVSPLAQAWSALLGARRGASLLARERLVALAATLEPLATPAAATGWTARAAARGALAARLIGSDGLAAHLGRLAPSARGTRLALGADLLDELAPGPTWLIVLAAEAALTEPEARRRAARQVLLGRLGRHAADAWPAGLALALGRLDALTFFPDEARRALELAAARGERHVERAALDALAPVLAELAAPPEATAAVRRRLDQLRALAAPTADDPDVPLPLTPESAAREQAALVRRAADAARRAQAGAAPDERWRAAVEALCGPLLDLPPAPETAADGLHLTLTEEGRWALRASDAALTRLARAPDLPPGALARALVALAPALVAQAAPLGASDPDAAWAHAADTALVRGAASFEELVITPFRRHDLTRAQVRALVHLGLTETQGLYKSLARRWQLPDEAYQRALDFLRRANAALDFRPYRRGGSTPERS